MATKTQPPKPTAAPGTQPVSVPKLIRDLAVELIGTERGADAWLAMANPELGGASPTELIAQGRADIVERFIQSNIHGNFG